MMSYLSQVQPFRELVFASETRLRRNRRDCVAFGERVNRTLYAQTPGTDFIIPLLMKTPNETTQLVLYGEDIKHASVQKFST